MVWTNVAKPSTLAYTNVNPQGREQYDQSSIAYDDSSIFYDGYNPAQWSNVAKPSYSLSWNDLPVAWNSYSKSWQSPTWTALAKPQ